MMAAFGACTDELPGAKGDVEVPDLEASGKMTGGYAAFRIYMPGEKSTRADYVHDADFEDYEEIFNKGLDYERALYLPEREEEEPEPDPEAGDEPQQADDADTPDAPAVTEPEEIYHFALLAKPDGSLEPNLFPLLWDEKKDEPDGESTLYTYFYSPEEKDENVYEKFNGHTIFVVLNASHKLVETIKEQLSASTPLNLETLKKFTLAQTKRREDFLFLKDSKGDYITDEEGHKYFTMSSSMVIDKNSVVPAVTGGFKTYSSEEDARNNPTSLYVERLHAKYTLLFKKNGSGYFLTDQDDNEEEESRGYFASKRLFIDPSPVDEDGNLSASGDVLPIKYVSSYSISPSIDERYSVNVTNTTNWKVNIVGWGINGIEKDQYLFKNLTPGASYTTGNNWFSYSDNYRNFWSEDPNYKEGVYPDQFREAWKLVYDRINDENLILPDPTIRYYKENEATLDYFNFIELSNKANRAYIQENTFDLNVLGDNAFTTKSYLRTGSHLIVTAQLLIGGESNDPFDVPDVYNSQDFDNEGLVYRQRYDVSSKYLMNGIYWSETAYKNYVCEYLGYWLLEEENVEKFGPNDGRFYINMNRGRANGSYFDIVKVYLKGGDATVMLMPSQQLYVMNPETEEYRPVSDDEFRILFFQHQNYMAQRFNKGRMYYVSGSLHNLKSNFTNPVKIGDYGTVRNTWYSFVIDGITAPGTPVADENQKIIPNNQPGDPGLGVSLRILDWHREFINVDVGSQRPKKQ